ncbi:MAG: MBL fold metallo-hydrolase, partial [Myxococcota bacterium]|nr:MBL fold metallo-hydrolase [Myxococcota bacterium]
NMVVAPFLGVVAVPFALLAQILPEPLNGGCLVVADAAVAVAVFLLSMLQVPVWKPATGLLGVITLFIILSFRRRETWVLFSLILFFCIFPRRKDGFRVVFLPIGQGDAALVEWSDGRTWLIDAGPPSRSLLRYLRRRGIQKLERVFLSHPHRDHMGGLDSLVGELDIERFWSPRPPIAGELEYRRLWSRMIKQGTQMQSKQKLSESNIRLLHPLNGWSGGGKDAVNEQSLVLELQHGDHRFLFTGDVGQHAESLLVKEERLFQGYDVVKVAHHGSRYSSSDAFIKRVQAEYAVISCGVKNRFGHPHTATLWRWRKSRILRSDQQGLIEFESDGKILRARTWNWESGWKSLPRNRKE